MNERLSDVDPAMARYVELVMRQLRCWDKANECFYVRMVLAGHGLRASNRPTCDEELKACCAVNCVPSQSGTGASVFGLFACRDIPSGQLVACFPRAKAVLDYEGTYFPPLSPFEQSHMSPLIPSTKGARYRWVVPHDYDPASQELAHMANDVIVFPQPDENGLRRVPVSAFILSAHRTNCCFVLSVRTLRMWLVTMRAVEAGEELTVSRGIDVDGTRIYNDVGASAELLEACLRYPIISHMDDTIPQATRPPVLPPGMASRVASALMELPVSATDVPLV